MNEASFWQLIESTGSPNDPAEKEDALRRLLMALPAEDVADFNRIYQDKMRRAYTWPLWAAGFIIGRGCSDDGFTEFRNYVIGHGRSLYDAAIASPDDLAERLVEIRREGPSLMPFLPSFDLIPAEVYEEQTGDDLPFESSDTLTPSGTPWKESKSDLERTCPRLWKRFGGEWIRVFEKP